MSTKVQNLRQENEVLRRKIQELEKQRLNAGSIDGEIKKFIEESEKNINDMTEKVTQENAQMNKKLQDLTVKYETILKSQIALLTKNKELNERKQKQDEVFNQKVQKITADYEAKIKDFEAKVKGNVKKIKDINQTNIIKKLLRSERFKTQMTNRGIRIDVLEKQSQLEDIINAVEQKQTEIAEMETKSQSLDEELNKMRELIETMKLLLENMVKQKENIVKQNVLLKEKLRQSQELIGKLLGTGMGEDGEDLQDEEYEQDFEQEGQQQNKSPQQ